MRELRLLILLTADIELTQNLIRNLKGLTIGIKKRIEVNYLLSENKNKKIKKKFFF